MNGRMLLVTVGTAVALGAGAPAGPHAQSQGSTTQNPNGGTTVNIPSDQPSNPDMSKSIPGFIGNPIAPPPMLIPAGFTPIFNGVNLEGWHVSRTNHHGITPDFHVMDGLIVGTQQPLGSGGILLTNQRYKNVEVYMEVKPDWGCDSGLFLRSDEAGNAYQVTLDYLPGGSLGSIYGEGLTGVGSANAANGNAPGRGQGGQNAAGRQGGNAAAGGRGGQNASVNTETVVGGIPLGQTQPVGGSPWMKVWKREEWNTVRARIEGDVPHITAWINGTQVLDFTDTANHASGGITSGYIGIQVHGGPQRWVPGGFWRWRVIAIRQLPD
jgi:3-keto-disaccharide hydrolase